MRKKYEIFCFNNSFKHLLLLFILSSISACGGGGGEDNNGGDDSDTTIPSTPQNLVTVPGIESVQLNWDSVSGATSYKIYWNTTGNVSASDSALTSNTNEYQHTNLSTGLEYHYIVTAINDAGESSASNSVSAFPLLDSPKNITTIRSDAVINLSWSDVAAAESYNLYWSTSADVLSISSKIENVSSPFTHDNLNNRQQYYYYITAANSRGESAASQVAIVQPYLMTVPQNVQAISGDSQSTVTWNDVSDALSYNLYWKKDISGVTTNDNQIINVTSPYVHDSLINNDIYFYVVTAVYAGGESDPSEEVSVVPRIPPPYSIEQQKIIAIDAQPSDEYGSSVDIDGSYAIVGAPLEDGVVDDPVYQSGAAYIHYRDPLSGVWDAGHKIVAPDPGPIDIFGVPVGISGDYAIVGAYTEDGGIGDPISNAGAAYIYQRIDTNSWDNGTRLVPIEQGVDYRFGADVAIHGDYAVVGAYGQYDSIGAAYVFHRDPNTGLWDSGAKLVAADGAIGKWFGADVAIHGDYAVVGAYSPFNPSPGAAYIFHRTGTNTWDDGTKIVGPNSVSEDNFGFSVDINGDTVIVGAGWGDSYGAYIYNRVGVNTWSYDTNLIPASLTAPDYYGNAVSIYGDYALVGAFLGISIDSDPQLNGGAAYIFERNSMTGIWDYGNKIISSDIEVADEFGVSVSLSNDYSIIGAKWENGGEGSPLHNAGAAYIFKKQ